MIKVSIIIPAFNVEKYISRAILSVVSQKMKEIEIIIINDGSTDRTLDEVKYIMEKEPRIKLFNIENSGVSNARNLGVNRASGEYIMFLDADDWIDKNCLEELYIRAKKNKLDILTFNYCTVFKENTEEYKIYTKDEIIDGKDGIRQVLNGNITASVCDKFIKRELFEKNIKFDPSIAVGEDLLLVLKLVTQSKRIGKVNKCFYFYFMREDSVTHNVTEKIFTIRKAIVEIEKYLSNRNILGEYYEEYEFLRFMHLYYYRVIVGNINDYYHKDFYDKFNAYRYIDNNEYVLKFIKESTIHVRIRIWLYKYNYKIARFIHKTMISVKKPIKI